MVGEVFIHGEEKYILIWLKCWDPLSGRMDEKVFNFANLIMTCLGVCLFGFHLSGLYGLEPGCLLLFSG